MAPSNVTRVAMIGCGGMARYHIQGMLKQTDTTQITWVCEPSPAAYEKASAMFTEAGLHVSMEREAERIHVTARFEPAPC